MKQIFDVSGSAGSTSFLLTGGAQSALFDCGMAYSAPQLIQNIEAHLGDKPLDVLFVSHTHYDHLGALPYLRLHWPNLKVYGANYAQYVLTRPGALKTIWEFSCKAAQENSVELEVYDNELLKIDTALADRETVNLGGVTVQAVELLGHTKCSMGYLIDGGTLFASESTGCMSEDGSITATYLVSPKASLRSIEICRELAPKYIVTPHLRLIAVKDHPDYWDRCEAALTASKDFILELHRQGLTHEEIFKAYEEKYWVGDVRVHQPWFAFEANANVMIKMVLAEFEDEI